MRVPKVDVIVLGTLDGTPCHGYELLERLRARGMDLWATVAKASVYQSLRRLERAGLIAGREQEGVQGPDRRVFHVTKAGRDLLTDELEDRFGDAGAFETMAGPALGFLQLLSPAGRRRGIAARERALRGMIGALRKRGEELESSADAAMMVAGAMLDRQASLAEAELAWLHRIGPTLSPARRLPTVG